MSELQVFDQDYDERETDISYIYISPRDLNRTLYALEDGVADFYLKKGVRLHKIRTDDEQGYIVGISCMHGAYGFEEAHTGKALKKHNIPYILEKYQGNSDDFIERDSLAPLIPEKEEICWLPEECAP